MTLREYAAELDPEDPGWLDKALSTVYRTLWDAAPELQNHTRVEIMRESQIPFFNQNLDPEADRYWYTDLFVPDGCSGVMLAHMALHVYDNELTARAHAGQENWVSNSRRMLNKELQRWVAPDGVRGLTVRADPGGHDTWFRLASWTMDLQMGFRFGTVLLAGGGK